MPFDERLAERVRIALKGVRGVREKKMFGGLCFLVRGNMCCGLVGDVLMVRVGPDRYESALGRPHAREMDFTGRAMRGMVYVDPPGLRTAAALKGWVQRGLDFTRTLPAKPVKK